LAPYARESEIKTLDLLESSLLPSNLLEVDSVILEKLRHSAPQDVEQLLGHLQGRARELATSARAFLARRAEQEAKAMTDILTSQKKRASDLARKHASNQLYLDFGDWHADEQRQLESNKRYWEKRLAAIDRELQTEPERIKAVYEVKAQRIEPVGLVYL